MKDQWRAGHTLTKTAFFLPCHLNPSLLLAPKRQTWGCWAPLSAPPLAVGTLDQCLFSAFHWPSPLQYIGSSVLLAPLQPVVIDPMSAYKEQVNKHSFKENTTILESWSVTICRVGHRSHDGYTCKLGWQNPYHSFLQCVFASAQNSGKVMCPPPRHPNTGQFI